METPVFKLPGIVKEKEETVDFEGPLTLILQLLQKNKVEIRDISVTAILEQYTAYLDEMAELNLDIASEFITMASYLMFIKTKMLLNEGEEISELEQLMTSLEQLQRGDTYQQIKEISETLAGMYTREGLMMAGPPEYIETEKGYQYVHISQELLDAIYRIVGKENLRLSSIANIEQVQPERVTYPISEKITQIVDKLKRSGSTTIIELFEQCQSRTELIAVVVAVLELCRVGSVTVTGDTSGDSAADALTLSYTGAGREDNIIDFTVDNADDNNSEEESN